MSFSGGVERSALPAGIEPARRRATRSPSGGMRVEERGQALCSNGFTV